MRFLVRISTLHKFYSKCWELHHLLGGTFSLLRFGAMVPWIPGLAWAFILSPWDPQVQWSKRSTRTQKRCVSMIKFRKIRKIPEEFIKWSCLWFMFFWVFFSSRILVMFGCHGFCLTCWSCIRSHLDAWELETLWNTRSGDSQTNFSECYLII